MREQTRKPIVRFRGRQNGFLSNFYMYPFPHNSVTLKSVEHGFQAEKARYPEDRERIWLARSAREAKLLGRRIEITPYWDSIKLAVMLDLLRSKFSVPELRERLLNTGDALLVEGNTWGDTFWGADSVTGVGNNWLGQLLMVVRSEAYVDTSLEKTNDANPC